MKVSASVTDSPFFIGLDNIFARLKDSGIDGIEITPGVKSRWNFSKLKELSDKFQLPVTSVHQPPWSVAGFWFDEGYIASARKIGVTTFVFHPPAGISFEDKEMMQFLQKLSDLQDKYGINALLENMPWAVRPALLRKHLPYPKDTTNPEKIFKAAGSFNLGMTFDTSHAFIPNPQDQEWFPKIYPGIKNIHLSSFKDKRDHLPLDMGDFNIAGFISDLRKRQYTGLITLEILYPHKISFKDYDFGALKRSVKLVKQ